MNHSAILKAGVALGYLAQIQHDPETARGRACILAAEVLRGVLDARSDRHHHDQGALLIADMIDDFERRSADAMYTDTSEAWELLEAARNVIRLACGVPFEVAADPDQPIPYTVAS